VGWQLTDDVAAYADRVWDLLARNPVEHTIALTVIASVRAGHRWSDDPMLFGWYEDGGDVRGAVSMTPPYELLLAHVPEDSTAELVATLRDRAVLVPGVNGAAPVVDRFTRLWTRGTDLPAIPGLHLRLYRLATLEPPPSPPGRARPADSGDLALTVRWMREFEAEARVPSSDVESMMRMRIADRRVWLWEDGAPGSFAARTPPAAGVARIAPVYTPPDRRRHGYGAAVTAACAQDAIARGEQVVLFTDLANPTSNAIYRRIGFRPVGDYRVVRFGSSDESGAVRGS
jgi:predicted GNAT family acetyltransferase